MYCQTVTYKGPPNTHIHRPDHLQRTLVTTDKVIFTTILRFACLPNLMTGAKHVRSLVNSATCAASIATAAPANNSKVSQLSVLKPVEDSDAASNHALRLQQLSCVVGQITELNRFALVERCYKTTKHVALCTQ